jgi:hypothetical protein
VLAPTTLCHLHYPMAVFDATRDCRAGHRLVTAQTFDPPGPTSWETPTSAATATGVAPNNARRHAKGTTRS